MLINQPLLNKQSGDFIEDFGGEDAELDESSLDEEELETSDEDDEDSWPKGNDHEGEKEDWSGPN